MLIAVADVKLLTVLKGLWREEVPVVLEKHHPCAHWGVLTSPLPCVTVKEQELNSFCPAIALRSTLLWLICLFAYMAPIPGLQPVVAC